MAQIKKLQNGGTPTVETQTEQQAPEVKTGGLKMAGNTYDLNDVRKMVANLRPEEQAVWGGIMEGIENGKVYTVSADGRISGDGVDRAFDSYFGGSKRADRISGGTSRFRKRMNATFGDDKINIAARSVRNMFNQGLTASIQNEEAEKAAALIDLGLGSGWFDYNPETGVFSDNPANQNRLDLIADWSKYLSLDPKEADKLYKVNGISGRELESLRNFYKAKNGDGNFINLMIDKIKNKQELSDAEIGFLNTIGYSQDPKVLEKQRQLALWKSKGYDQDAYDYFSPHFKISDSGRLELIGNTNWAFANQNAWFNDDWKQGSSDFEKHKLLHGKIQIDGKLYDASEAKDPNSELSQILRRKNGFYDLNKAGDFKGSNEILKWQWYNPVSYKVIDPKNYASDFINGNIRFRDETGRYDYDGKTDEDQLISYFDITGSDVDDFGFNKAVKYAILDKYGNFVRDIDFGKLSEISNYKITPTQLTEVWSTADPHSEYKQVVPYNMSDKNGNPVGVTIFVDRASKLPKIYSSQTLDSDFLIPKQMRQLLTYDALKKIVNDGYLRSKFETTIKYIRGTGVGQLWKTEMSVDDWARVLGDRNKAQAMYKLVREFANSGSADSRRASVDSARPEDFAARASVDMKKVGGLIRRYQWGGTPGEALDTIGASSNIVSLDQPVKELDPGQDYSAAETIGRMFDPGESLTDYEKADLAAFGADLVSLLSSFGKGAVSTGVSVASGIGGTAARLYGDISRDGFQGKDLTNFGIGLGMDVLGLVPILGNASKAKKAITSAKLIIPTLIKAASLYGISAGSISAVQKIANGEKFTFRDVADLVNVLGAGIGLKRTGLGYGRHKGSASSKVEDFSVKVKGQDYTVSGMSADTAKNLKGKSEAEIEKAIVDHINASRKAADPAAEDITVADVDFSGAKSKEKTNWWKFWDKKEVLNAPSVTESKGKWQYDADGKLHDWGHGEGKGTGNAFKDWVTGRGKYEIINRQMLGDPALAGGYAAQTRAVKSGMADPDSITPGFYRDSSGKEIEFSALIPENARSTYKLSDDAKVKIKESLGVSDDNDDVFKQIVKTLESGKSKAEIDTEVNRILTESKGKNRFLSEAESAELDRLNKEIDNLNNKKRAIGLTPEEQARLRDAQNAKDAALQAKVDTESKMRTNYMNKGANERNILDIKSRRPFTLDDASKAKLDELNKHLINTERVKRGESPIYSIDKKKLNEARKVVDEYNKKIREENRALSEAYKKRDALKKEADKLQADLDSQNKAISDSETNLANAENEINAALHARKDAADVDIKRATENRNKLRDSKYDSDKVDQLINKFGSAEGRASLGVNEGKQALYENLEFDSSGKVKTKMQMDQDKMNALADLAGSAKRKKWYKEKSVGEGRRRAVEQFVDEAYYGLLKKHNLINDAQYKQIMKKSNVEDRIKALKELVGEETFNKLIKRESVEASLSLDKYLGVPYPSRYRFRNIEPIVRHHTPIFTEDETAVSEDENRDGTYYKRGGLIPKAEHGTVLFGDPEKASNINLSQIYKITSPFRAHATINKLVDVRKQQADALELLRSAAPQTPSSRYISSGVEQKYNDAANKKLSMKSEYADAGVNAAMDAYATSEAENNRLQGFMEGAKEYSVHAQNERNVQAQNAINRAQAESQNRAKIDYTREYGLKDAVGQGLKNHYDVDETAKHDIYNEIKSFEEGKHDIARERETQAAKLLYDNLLNSSLRKSPFYEKWKTETTEGKANENDLASYYSWFKTYHPEEFTNIQRNASEASGYNTATVKENELYRRYGMFMRRGGKLDLKYAKNLLK